MSDFTIKPYKTVRFGHDVKDNEREATKTPEPVKRRTERRQRVSKVKRLLKAVGRKLQRPLIGMLMRMGF
jgi:hypothetical protein